MKRTFFLWLLMTLMGGVATVSAQEHHLKIAYTNADSILKAMPETKTKLKILETHTKQLQAQLEAKQKEIQAKYQDYQTNAPNWIPEVIRSKEQEIQQLEQNIQEFQTTAQQSLQKKQTDEFAPLYKKIKEAIDAVAKEHHYTYVIAQDDSSNFPLLYADKKYDITELVIKKILGNQ